VNRVDGLILAAGAGSRFGRPKALATFRGQVLVDRAATTLLAGGCHDVHAVVGAAAEVVRAASGVAVLGWIQNPDWRLGLSTSLRAGLEALGAEVDAAVIVLVDQPLIDPSAVARVIAAWRQGAPMVRASYGGVPGHPVLLDRSVWPAVAATATGDRGAGAFLDARPDVVTVACDGLGRPADVDTREDLAALEQRTE
jgi:CTP:molybdopterin cytidylyltransferase MocA